MRFRAGSSFPIDEGWFGVAGPEKVTAGRPVAPADEVWGPLVLDEQISGDCSVIAGLRSDPANRVRDLYPALLAELSELHADTAAERCEPPRWIYYPWRSSLVRILGPNGYRRLRLDRNHNKITAAEQAFHAGLRIGVVGASVGHPVAMGLALEGLFGTVRIADFDTVALSNLNRLPGSILDHGVNKAVLLARRIAELDPYLTVQTYSAGVTVDDAATFVSGLDLVIEVVDSLDVKLALREEARRAGIPLITVTSDRGTVDVERYDLQPDRPLFHGMVGDPSTEMLANLRNADKVPFAIRILGVDGVSARMAASMLEIGETLTAWPHLAGDALQAAAGAVAAVRRFGRGRLPSGRLHLDVENRLDDLIEPIARPKIPEFTRSGDYRNLEPPHTAVEAVVRAGQLAPSGGNCQPWRFVPGTDVIRVELDAKQTNSVDVEFRASFVAIGAALWNMRIAAAEYSLDSEIESFPNGFTDPPAAMLRLRPGKEGPKSELAAAYSSMMQRVTNRNFGEPGRRIPSSILETLVSAARSSGEDLSCLESPEELAEVAELFAEADRIRYLLPVLHAEMMGELRDPRTDPIDRGIDLRTLEIGEAAVMLDLVRRPEVMTELAEADLGRNLSALPRALVESSAAVVAVTVSGDTPDDYLRAGQAMQRVWIAATAAGLAVQPFVPLYLYARTDIELAAVSGSYRERLTAARKRLRELFGIGDGQEFAMLLRLNYAPAPSAISLRSAETSF